MIEECRLYLLLWFSIQITDNYPIIANELKQSQHRHGDCFVRTSLAMTEKWEKVMRSTIGLFQCVIIAQVFR